MSAPTAPYNFADGREFKYLFDSEVIVFKSDWFKSRIQARRI